MKLFFRQLFDLSVFIICRQDVSSSLWVYPIGMRKAGKENWIMPAMLGDIWLVSLDGWHQWKLLLDSDLFPSWKRFSNLCVRSISWILFTSHFTTENELPTRAIPSGLWSPDEIFLHHLPPSTIFLTPSCWWAQAAGTLCIPEGQSP